MAVAGKLVLNTDGAAWYSGPPDPTTFQETTPTHVWVYTGSAWVECITVWLWDGSIWNALPAPAYPTLTVSDGTFCTGTATTYQVSASVTNIPTGASYELRGFKSTTGDSGYVAGTPSFTQAEGDGGTCWGYYQIRVKMPYSGWSAWSGDSTHIHCAINLCGRPG